MRLVIACSVLAVAAAAAAGPAGRWTTSIELDYSANPTMEMLVTRSVRGAAAVELTDDGKGSGGVGSDGRESSAISHYQSSDRKDHANQEEYRQLRALRGTWRASASGLDITFD